MRPPKNPRSLSNEALSEASRRWDARVAEILDRLRMENPDFREAIDTALKLDEIMDERKPPNIEVLRGPPLQDDD